MNFVEKSIDDGNCLFFKYEIHFKCDNISTHFYDKDMIADFLMTIIILKPYGSRCTVGNHSVLLASLHHHDTTSQHDITTSKKLLGVAVETPSCLNVMYI